MIEPYASEIFTKLTGIGKLSDEDIDVFDTAILIAALEHTGRSIDRYKLHRDRMVKACLDILNEGEQSDTAHTRLYVLRQVIAKQEEYSGDNENYDRLDNADLMSVVDRREGLPISLAIIYISVAKSLGWNIEALSFPAHVFLRIDYDGERIIFDPFDDAKEMDAHDLREKLKSIVGDHAELSSNYYDAMDVREVILRLQNNIKTRLIATEDFDGALQRIEIMQLVSPEDPRLLFEAGVLNARAGQHKRAIKFLYSYLDVAESQSDKEDAMLLLRELENSVN